MKKIVIILKTAQKCISVLMVAILLIAFMTSCRYKVSIDPDDPDEPKPANPHKEVNDWILENMETFYLWNTQIPSKTNKTLSPDDYFESLLYTAEDRFSWIQEDYVTLINSLSGVNTEAGYDFALLLLSQSSSDVIGCITYIKSNTPAEDAGLKRGDFFRKINGTQMTTTNYQSLLGRISEPHTLGLDSLSAEGRLTGKIKNVSLQVIENYSENPILLDTVYDISDRKIGYFVYNFFARDNGDGSVAYEKELNDIFDKFKKEEINELIVDLRYNGGGAVITAEVLASMISGKGKNDLFSIMECNSLLHTYYYAEEGADYNKSYFFNNIERYNGNTIVERIPINKLSGLSTVYFIVTNNSASASELLINGLKPYMNNIVLVGDTTFGKNVASFTIYETDVEKQKTNKWGMQPIVWKIRNADGFSDYSSGFAPDIKVSEFGEFTKTLFLKPLGDTAEVMLKTALNDMFGITTRGITTKHIDNEPIYVGSSMDRTPARRNQYITLKDLTTKENR
jgi:C-terminal processing protease CtpA/Prc